MPPETRRAARAAAAQPAPTPAERPRRRRRRVVWITISAVLVVLLGVAAWVGVRALTVKSELEAAQRLLGSSGDDLSSADRFVALGEHAEKASDVADDPVWRALEWVPIAGDNLRAVRLASDALDLLANDVAGPALAAMDDEAAGSPLAKILPVLQTQAPAVTAMAAEVSQSAQSSWLIGPVRSGIDQVDGVLQAAAPVVDAIPALLGADGSRTYLLVFQNNAEVSALGGSAASQTLITADGGDIRIVGQAGSGDFAENIAVDVPVDQSAIDLYSRYLVDHVNTTTSRPDFPTAAQLLRAFWQRDISPDPIDGVISIDPIALGRILEATGPIAVGDVELTSKNAVSVLLKDVYSWWDPYASKAEAAASDAFFATVAVTVFDKLSTGAFDLKDMAWALNESIAQGDIMMWMTDPEISALIDGQRVAGVLPTDNIDQTTVGVFYRDTSAGKIDYYMDSAVTLTRTCAASESTFTAQAALHLDITQEEADALPAYVQSYNWGSEQFRTEIFVYGPPGTSFVSASVDGRDVSPVRTDIDDLGRPVASFLSFLRPGETDTVTAVFSGTGEFGPLELRSTPMIKPTETTVDDTCG